MRVRTISTARLALAGIAVIVARDDGGIDVGREGDGFAETVTGEGHLGVRYGSVQVSSRKKKGGW